MNCSVFVLCVLWVPSGVIVFKAYIRAKSQPMAFFWTRFLQMCIAKRFVCVSPLRMCILSHKCARTRTRMHEQTNERTNECEPNQTRTVHVQVIIFSIVRYGSNKPYFLHCCCCCCCSNAFLSLLRNFSMALRIR